MECATFKKPRDEAISIDLGELAFRTIRYGVELGDVGSQQSLICNSDIEKVVNLTVLDLARFQICCSSRG